jgi:guanylate kinase
MKRHGLLIVLSAPSGGGKTTICEALLRRRHDLVRSVSATTRPPRRGEREGRDYFFLSEASFARQVRARAFLEWARVHGHRYGTPKRAVERQRRQGKDVVTVIDVQGGLTVKRRERQAVLIFVWPPSLPTLEKRLRGRGTDAPATIRTRLQNARWEMSLARYYDYAVINQRLPEAVRQVEAIITAEHLRSTPRQFRGTRSRRKQYDS